MDDHRRYTLPAARDGEIELKKKVPVATDASHRTNGENFANDTLVKIRLAPGEDSKWSKETFKVHGMNSHGAYVLVDAEGKVVERLFARDQLKRTSAFAVQKEDSHYARITAKEYKSGAILYTVIRKDNKRTETVPVSGVNDALVKEFEARVRRANKEQACICSQ